MTDKDYILNRVKMSVHSFDPDAEIILYGSRARGVAQDDSDWDFLILTSVEFSSKTKSEISRAIFDIELETGEILIPIIHAFDYWNRPQNHVTPFYKNVQIDGITI